MKATVPSWKESCPMSSLTFFTTHTRTHTHTHSQTHKYAHTHTKVSPASFPFMKEDENITSDQITNTRQQSKSNNLILCFVKYINHLTRWEDLCVCVCADVCGGWYLWVSIWVCVSMCVFVCVCMCVCESQRVVRLSALSILPHNKQFVSQEHPSCSCCCLRGSSLGNVLDSIVLEVEGHRMPLKA